MEAWAKGVRQGARQGGGTGSEMGARQVCCLLLPLPPHGGGDLKFYYGGGDTKIQYKMLYGARQGSETGSKTGTLPLTPLATSWWWGP